MSAWLVLLYYKYLHRPVTIVSLEYRPVLLICTSYYCITSIEACFTDIYQLLFVSVAYWPIIQTDVYTYTIVTQQYDTSAVSL